MSIHHRKPPAHAALMPKGRAVCQRCGNTATITGTEETTGRRAKDQPTIVIVTISCPECGIRQQPKVLKTISA
jgi:RNase P subunit RPR2